MPYQMPQPDVYKRQVTFRADKYLKHQLSDVKTERSKYKPHSMPVTKESIDAVSYTHLDVYKRQVLQHYPISFLDQVCYFIGIFFFKG